MIADEALLRRGELPGNSAEGADGGVGDAMAVG